MTERTEFAVLKKLNIIEIRRYPRLMLVTVYNMTDDSAFGILFDYISGNNKMRRRLPMSAPVISESSGERVPMTVPVLSTTGSFSFVLPKYLDRTTAPEPLDRRAVVQEIPERTVAVLPFRGRTRDSQVREKVALLSNEVREAGLEPVGEPFLMRYNPPFIPGIFRHNEVGVEIRSWQQERKP